MKFITIILVLLLGHSCSYRPVLAPNAKFKSVGAQTANYDVDQCVDEAKQYLKESKRRRAAKEGVRGIGMGAIFGAIWGIFTGNADDIVKNSVIGAGIGGATRSMGVIAGDKLSPDQMQQKYVAICLKEKGYNILGWE